VDNNFGRNSRLVTSGVARREQGFILAPTHTTRKRDHVGSSQLLALFSLGKRAKVRPMGHNRGRDNAKKRRKKDERLASAKKKQQGEK
jgi:hypothetical protein